MTELLSALSGFEGLIGAIIGAMTVLVANYITQNRTWKREDRLRNYEMRRDVYTTVLTVGSLLAEELDNLESDPHHPTEDLDKALDKLSEATITLRLLAPSEIAVQGNFVYSAAGALVNTPPDKWTVSQRGEFWQKLMKFVEAARKDLEVPRLFGG